MINKLRLMCILAHPDDESLGVGGTLAKYASEGIETFLITATRGERGRVGDIREAMGLEAVGRVRENELRKAARKLGVREVNFLEYIDGDLDQADPAEAVSRIADHIQRLKPQVVITFGPEGAYGHPDHIAISQFTSAATILAADSSYKISGNRQSFSEAHQVSKLYYIAWTKAKWDAYQSAFRDLKITVDEIERRVQPWPDWAITTYIDTAAFWTTTWQAVSCHKTQMSIYRNLEHLPKEHHQAIWGSQEFYRAFSLVNGGRKRESDLFEGLA